MDADLKKFLTRLETKLDRVYALLRVVDATGELLMTVASDLKDQIAALNDETTAIGAEMALLIGRIGNSMTDVEVADVKASLTSLSDRLTGLGQDPPVTT